jgi:hypothetical protein
MSAETASEIHKHPTKAAAAEYIAVQASRLARLANASNLGLLAYLIDMAVLEAWREASEPRGGRRPAPPSRDGMPES